MGKSLFGKFYSPYANNAQVTIEDCYHSYKQDPDNKTTIGNRVFTKIICNCRFYGHKDFSYHVIWEPSEEIHLHDLLIDENNNLFEVHSFEMIRFSGEIPEWYLNALPLVITGTTCEIGHYLAKK